jgi:hypothetical protein
VNSSLVDELQEFVHDHRAHGPLTTDATEPAWTGYLLTVMCSCGVVFERWIAQVDAGLDLLRSGGVELNTDLTTEHATV